MAYFSLQNFKNFINYEAQHNFSITQMLNSRAYVIYTVASLLRHYWLYIMRLIPIFWSILHLAKSLPSKFIDPSCPWVSKTFKWRFFHAQSFFLKAERQLKLKYWIFQALHGLKLRIIHMITGKFFLLFKSWANFSSKLIFFSVTYFATLTTSQGTLIIGGYSDKIGIQNTVACYNDSGRSKLDYLQSVRAYHRAIINDGKVYIVGGSPVGNPGDSRYAEI